MGLLIGVCCNSDALPLGRGLWQDGGGPDAGAAAIHVREAEDPGGYYEGYEDGAHTQEGAEPGQG